jgi:hypothetical protein
MAMVVGVPSSSMRSASTCTCHGGDTRDGGPSSVCPPWRTEGDNCSGPMRRTHVTSGTFSGSMRQW